MKNRIRSALSLQRKDHKPRDRQEVDIPDYLRIVASDLERYDGHHSAAQVREIALYVEKLEAEREGMVLVSLADADLFRQWYNYMADNDRVGYMDSDGAEDTAAVLRLKAVVDAVKQGSQ